MKAASGSVKKAINKQSGLAKAKYLAAAIASAAGAKAVSPAHTGATAGAKAKAKAVATGSTKLTKYETYILFRIFKLNS